MLCCTRHSVTPLSLTRSLLSNPVELDQTTTQGPLGTWASVDARPAPAFLDTARQHRLFAIYRPAAYTGAWRGELLNLRWRNADLDLGEVRITDSAAVIGGQRIERTTKSGDPAPSASARTRCKRPLP